MEYDSLSICVCPPILCGYVILLLKQKSFSALREFRPVTALVRILPFEGRAALLNGGVYFPVPINLGVEKARRSVDSGLIAYWPMARSLCIFYGAAKPHTPVNPVGKVRAEDLNVFRQVKMGTKITVVKI